METPTTRTRLVSLGGNVLTAVERRDRQDKWLLVAAFSNSERGSERADTLIEVLKREEREREADTQICGTCAHFEGIAVDDTTHHGRCFAEPPKSGDIHYPDDGSDAPFVTSDRHACSRFTPNN